jgi:hypothetical protein
MDNVLSGKLLDLLEIEQVPGCDLFTVARFMVTSDAHLAKDVLVANGIPALVADANHAIPSIEGARVQVPEMFLEQSRETLRALARGDFALGDDADVGSPA